MTIAVFILLFFLAACAALFLLFELSATIIADWKGAGFVRSRKKQIKIMMELAELAPGKVAVDLGSGDGSILFEAARRGAAAIGVEFNPFLVRWSRMRAKRMGLRDRVVVFQGDFFTFPIHNADVLFLYLWPSTLAKLREKFSRELAPGARVVSHAFPIPGWTPMRKKENIYVYTL